MDKSNYKPFNKKKNYNNRQPSSLNKTIQINHYHSNNSGFQDYSKLQDDLKKANDLITKYSLDKPISKTTDDRYTPMAYNRCTSSFERDRKCDQEDEDDRYDLSPEILEKLQSLEKDNERLVRINNSLKMSPDISINTDNLYKPEPEIRKFTNKPNISRSSDLLNSNMNITKEESIKDDDDDDKLPNLIYTSSPNVLHIISRINFNDVSDVPKVETPKVETPKVEISKVEISKVEPILEEIIFTEEIKTILDLINLSKKYNTTEYPLDPTKKYSIDLHKLHAIVPYLKELDEMIGMENVKSGLVIQLMYFLQGFEYKHMLHTIIEGPPGVGKTCLGRILGKIYLELKCINTYKIEYTLSDDYKTM